MLKRMKHAGPGTLKTLAALLQRLRELPLKEKSRGVFYFKSRAFLHFHEDAAGIFADMRSGDVWQRFRVSTRREQAAVLAKTKQQIMAWIVSS